MGKTQPVYLSIFTPIRFINSFNLKFKRVLLHQFYATLPSDLLRPCFQKDRTTRLISFDYIGFLVRKIRRAIRIINKRTTNERVRLVSDDLGKVEFGVTSMKPQRNRLRKLVERTKQKKEPVNSHAYSLGNSSKVLFNLSVSTGCGSCSLISA